MVHGIPYELSRQNALTAADLLASRTAPDSIDGKNQCGLSLGDPIAADRTVFLMESRGDPAVGRDHRMMLGQ